MAKKKKVKAKKSQETLDSFIRGIFQKPYDFFKKMKSPDWLEKMGELLGKFVSIPKLIQVINIAYEISKQVETDGVDGTIKKEKVMEGINKFCDLINLKLSDTIKNFINELVTVYVKFNVKF